MLPRAHSKHHHRNHSWPPFRLHISHRKDIDEDPFSFFISSDNDSAGSMNDHLNADIDGMSRSRSHSPRLGRNRAKLLSSPTGKSILKLRKWVEKMEVRYFHARASGPSRLPKLPDVSEASQLDNMEGIPSVRVSDADTPRPSLKRPASPDESEEMVQYIPILDSPPMRGRRSRKSARRAYGDRMVRSHSKRARAWKEPGEGIWPVVEEDEQDGLGVDFLG